MLGIIHSIVENENFGDRLTRTLCFYLEREERGSSRWFVTQQQQDQVRTATTCQYSKLQTLYAKHICEGFQSRDDGGHPVPIGHNKDTFSADVDSDKVGALALRHVQVP